MTSGTGGLRLRLPSSGGQPRGLTREQEQTRGESFPRTLLNSPSAPSPAARGAPGAAAAGRCHVRDTRSPVPAADTSEE